MSSHETHDLLLKDAQRFDPALHTKSILGPHHDAILIYRAKFMSYEVIAATLTRHGIKVSPAAVGCFCRRHFTKHQIETVRRKRSPQTEGKSTNLKIKNPAPSHSLSSGSQRGPRIARDDF